MVVAIMAILAAVAIPRMAETVSRYRLEAAKTRILNDLALAQRRARVTGTSRTVRFLPAQEAYRLPEEAHLDNPSGVYRVQLWREPYEVDLVSADFDGDADLVFDGFGLPDSGGTVVIERGGYTATITVDANSGKASE